MTLLCPSCSFANPEGFRHCGQCGARLPVDAEPPAAAAERRQITVLFCDLVDSTGLSERLDPERLRDLILSYRRACVRVIERYGGQVGRYLGDGILVYFGYPQALEDGARRAVHTGLELVGAIRLLTKLVDTDVIDSLAVRIGIHTGLVVAGELGEGASRESMAVVGETPNVASRLQGLAHPNGVVISQATYRLVSGFFDCRSLGALTIRGLSRSMEVYEVTAAAPARDRLDAAPADTLTPMVDRHSEIGILLGSWQQSVEGHGQAVLLRGEAGIGKSRVLRAFRAEIAGFGHRTIELDGSPYAGDSAFHPVIAALRAELGFAPEDDQGRRLAKLERLLRALDLPVAEALPAFSGLLSLGDAVTDNRRHTLELLATWVVRTAADTPLLIVAEDLHWIDASTLELLDILTARTARTRLCMVMSCRPEFTASWSAGSIVKEVEVARLPRRDVEEMIGAITAGIRLPGEFATDIVARVDGVPLFVEELTKAVLESEVLVERDGRYEWAGPLPSATIPSTLSDSLLARLDRLGPAKSLAQIGAVLGRSFGYEHLRWVSGIAETALRRQLNQLVESGLLIQHGYGAEATYTFKHALVQEAAHNTLLHSQRQRLHARAGAALERSSGGISDAEPELIAWHFAAAGDDAKALDYWRRAGERATRLSAHQEAITHFSRALETLLRMPGGADRDRLEVGLQIALGSQWIAAKGNAAPEVEAAYERAAFLARRIETPDKRELFRALRGLHTFYLVRGRVTEARELGEILITLAEESGEAAQQLQAHRPQGLCLLLMGEFSAACAHLQQALALYSPVRDEGQRFEYGSDPAVVAQSQLAWTEWFSGAVDRALIHGRQAVRGAEALNHPHGLCHALCLLATIMQLRGEIVAARDRAEAALALASTHQLLYWQAWAQLVRGWAVAVEGNPQDGVVILEGAIVAYRATGAEQQLPYALTLLGDALRRATRIGAAAAAFDEADARAEATGVRYYLGLTAIARAELWVDSGDLPAAISTYVKAARIADGQGARSVVLRALLGLCRLSPQGELRNRLASVLTGMPTDDDSPDLTSARALLRLPQS